MKPSHRDIKPWSVGPRTHTYLDKLCERQIWALLFLEFILAVQLVRTVRDKGGKEWDVVTEDVRDVFDDNVRILTLAKCIAQTRVDHDHVVDIPKYLLNKISAAVFRDDV